MLKNKILIKVTGSIAAYKVAYLISKLVQNGFEVKTVVTKSALKFIGEATLEGLTGYPVYSDSFESGKMMSHINLTKWADLTILVPADANTINKYANGIADNLVTSLFLAHDFEKPYLIAPAMNVAMYNHPSTQNSLSVLKKWGMKVLPTEDGYLACGDEGKGKLLNPDKIYSQILNSLRIKKNSKKILITSGGTKEKIDNARYLTNLSTGRTGADLADDFFLQGLDVTFLKSKDSASPDSNVNILEYNDFAELSDLLKKELSGNNYHYVIHLAAVSDYSPANIKIGENNFDLPSDNKLKSSHETVILTLNRNPKLINSLKTWSVNKEIKIIGFKFSDTDSTKTKDDIVNKLFSDSNSDYIVYNSHKDRINNRQMNFELIEKNGKQHNAADSYSLSEKLIKIIKGQ